MAKPAVFLTYYAIALSVWYRHLMKKSQAIKLLGVLRGAFILGHYGMWGALAVELIKAMKEAIAGSYGLAWSHFTGAWVLGFVAVLMYVGLRAIDRYQTANFK